MKKTNEVTKLLNPISELKITTDLDNKRAKTYLSTLKKVIAFYRRETEKPKYYEIAIYYKDRLTAMIKEYEHLKNTNFRMATLFNYIHEYRLNDTQALTLKKTLFNF